MQQLMKRVVWPGVLAGLMSACAPNSLQNSGSPPAVALPATAPRDPWLLVDTRADRLMIMQGQQPVEVFHQVALGSSGAGFKHRRGDNKTPVGVFRVGWINDHSRFKRFIGLDYPNLEYAERALREHRIDHLTYERIRAAWMNGYTPPQDTPLGGQIGIHGVGAGDPQVHGAGIDWTSGCVALDNHQIEALRPWVKVGMRVEIR
jgi:murein L,D-transpeptidase YafK